MSRLAQLVAASSAQPERTEALRAELDRIECLIEAVQRHRDGKPLSEARRKQLAQAQKAVTGWRGTRAFDALTGCVQDADRSLALDCMMILSFGMLRPSQARNLQALAGLPALEFTVTQSLLHELLMPDPATEMRLTRLLSPAGALLRSGFLRSEGEGPMRQLRPGVALSRFVMGREDGLVPPEGVRLVSGDMRALPQLHLTAQTARRLAEVEALIRLIGDRAQAGIAGPSVLFTGGPGTGKTLAVHHLAHRLERPLYQIDLGRVVSKWLGETERNLTRIFTEMSGTQGCILIDEADALLGKRVEVRESRDQHANVTVSHLLSLLESHKGPVFLTTNLRGNLDAAYIRRFAAVVDFRRPDASLRGLVWRDALARLHPAASPEEIGERARLSLSVDLSAAEIANTALVATALADGALPAPGNLARAIRLEKIKAGLTFAPADLGDLAAYWTEEDI